MAPFASTISRPHKYFTNTNLKGNDSTSNRGYLDVLLFKRDALPFLMAQIPQEVELPADWIDRNVRPRMETHELYTKFSKAPSGIRH
jgi:hypothetical protein